jgi:ORF6N domain
VTSSSRQSEKPTTSVAAVLPLERIDSRIILVRGQKVLLDRDLAELYGIETRLLNRVVQRNRERFPDDFMLILTREEISRISQFGISSPNLKFSKSVSVFTEQGVAMLSGLLNSPRAVQVNIEIMRAFVRMRQLLSTHVDLARKLAALEKKYDDQFRAVFDAIRELMEPPAGSAREMGFHTLIKKPAKTTKR